MPITIDQYLRAKADEEKGGLFNLEEAYNEEKRRNPGLTPEQFVAMLKMGTVGKPSPTVDWRVRQTPSLVPPARPSPVIPAAPATTVPPPTPLEKTVASTFKMLGTAEQVRNVLSAPARAAAKPQAGLATELERAQARAGKGAPPSVDVLAAQKAARQESGVPPLTRVAGQYPGAFHPSTQAPAWTGKVLAPVGKVVAGVEEEAIAPLAGRLVMLGTALGFKPGEWAFQKPSAAKFGKVLGMSTEEARTFLRDQPMATQVLAEMTIPMFPQDFKNIGQALRMAARGGKIARAEVPRIIEETVPRIRKGILAPEEAAQALGREGAVPPVTLTGPTPARLMPQVVRLEDILRTGEAFQPDLPRRVGQAASKVPGVKGTMNVLFGPSSTARGDALAEAWIGWNRLVENFDAATKIGMARVRGVRNPLQIDRAGNVTNVVAHFPADWTGPQSYHISDVMQWWGKVFHGTPEQDRWIRTQWQLIDEAVTRYKAVGGEVHELGLERVGNHWYPREVFSKKGVDLLNRSRGGRLGTKPSALAKPRIFDLAAVGAANGAKYNADQAAVLETTLNAIGRATADRELIVNVAKRGKTALSMVNVELKRASAQAGQEYTWFNRILNFAKGNVRGRPATPIFRASQVYGTPSAATTDLLTRIAQANKLSVAARKAAIRDLVDEAQTLRDAAKAAWDTAKGKVTASRKNLAATGALPGRFFGRPGAEAIAVRQVGGQVPGLTGRIFTAEDADFILNHWADMPGPINRAGAQLSAAIRTGQTAFDPGFWFIQGLGPLGTDLSNLALLHPTARWPKAVFRSVEALVNPSRHQAYIAHAFERDRVGMTLFARYVGRVSWSEFTEGAKPGGLLMKIPLLGKGTTRVAQFFDAYANAAQIETWFGMYRMAHGDPAKLEQLAAWVRNSTLGVSSDRIGLTLTQQAVEGNWILYAPRYRRGGIALAFDALRAFAEPGSLRARQSLKSMAGIMAAANLMFIGTAKAVGMSNDEIIDGLKPWSGGRYLAIRIRGNYCGVGGVQRSLLTLAVRLGMAALDKPKGSRLDMLEWMPAGWNDNAIISAFRSGGAPASSTTFDLLTRETYLGEALENWGDIGKVAEQWLPFWLGGALEANGSLLDRILSGSAQFTGLRTFPMNPWSQLDYQISQMGITNSQGKVLERWADLTLDQQNEAIKNPEVKRLLDMAHADAQGVYAEINDIQTNRDKEINWEIIKLRKAGPTKEALQYFAGVIKDIKRDAARDSEDALIDAGADPSEPRNPDKKLYTDYLNYIGQAGRDAERAGELGERYRKMIGPDKTVILDRQIAADRNLFAQQHDTWKLEFSGSGYWEKLKPDGSSDTAARIALRVDNPRLDAIGLYFLIFVR